MTRYQDRRFQHLPDLDCFAIGKPLTGFTFVPPKAQDQAASVKRRNFDHPPEWFHPGQLDAWGETSARFILVLAGTQGGKTTYGPHWLIREMQRCGPGDYLIAGPSKTLLRKKVLPEFRKVFCKQFGLGREVKSPEHMFILSEIGELILFGALQSEPTVVYIGRGDEPDSLESMTLKAAWLDEAGQPRFKQGSWQAIQRRFGATSGRVLITTTPYDLGWLKSDVADRADKGDSLYRVVRFESKMNPAFDMAEWDRALRELPLWKFNLFYRAIFTRPAGAVYDIFERKWHTCRRFRIPDHWPRFLGADFGPLNMAGVKIAVDPETLDRRLHPEGPMMYCYRTYHKGGATTLENVKALMQLEPYGDAKEPWVPDAVGGNSTEDGWRNDFGNNGLFIRKPTVSEVSSGIQAVYSVLKVFRLMVFDDLDRLIGEFESYSRALDDQGQPIENEIVNKSAYHRLDALRYAISEWLHNAGFGRSQEVRSMAPAPEERSDEFGGYYGS